MLQKTYTLTLDKKWRKKVDKGPMFDYFYLIIDNERIAEFRPKCSNKKSYSLPEAVNNMQHFFEVQNLIANSTCYQKAKNTYGCRIDITNQQGVIKRVQWLGINTVINTGADLDLVVYKDYPSLQNEIQQVINSISFKKTEGDLNCLTLTEWM